MNRLAACLATCLASRLGSSWRRRTAVFGLLLLALAGPPLAAAEPATSAGGVNFEPRVQLAGQALVLNGTGVRQVAWFKGYAAALYLPQRATTADTVVAQPGAKRLQMRLLVDVPTAEFIKAFDKGIERNSSAEQRAQLAARAAQFDAQLKTLNQVKKGDVVNLDFMPGQGLRFTLNGRTVGDAIPGEDFYGALLRVFIGAQVSDNKLRAGLLGQPG